MHIGDSPENFPGKSQQLPNFELPVCSFNLNTASLTFPSVMSEESVSELELLHRFAWSEKTNTSEQDALDLLESCSSEHLASAKDKDGWTLAHHACYRGWLRVLEVLIRSHKADPHCLNNFLSTPLHWAAFGGHCAIVKYLVLELKCDPNAANRRGNTPLQIACWRGKLDVIKFLVLDCKCDPLKPNNNGVTSFQEALICNHVHVVSFLISTGHIDKLIHQDFKVPELLSDWYLKLFNMIIDFRRSNPLTPTLKVFVLGDTGVGKTTLVGVLEKKLRGSKVIGGKYRKLSSVEPHTVGVNPIQVSCNDSGPMILFDFAGHQEFYCSHAALLENLESSEGLGAVILLLLDLTKMKNELKTSIEAWMSFLDSLYSNNRPPLVVIGTHSDVLKQRREEPGEKLSSVCSSAGLYEWDRNCTCLTMNCTRLSSSELNSLSDQLHKHSHRYRLTFNMDAQAHIFSAIIREHFGTCTAVQIHEVVEFLQHQNEGLYHYHLLPDLSDEKTLSELISDLSELGEFVYLKSDTFKDGWIVFDKKLLFSEINGTIFSPNSSCFRQYLANSTGVVSKQKLQTTFKKHNVDMVTKFLLHFKYCYKILEANNFAESTELYFFPHLVNESKPDLSYFEECSYSSKWQLRCTKSYQCFTTRFTQSIIVQLASLYGLTPEDNDILDQCPVILRECNIWNLGIHWKDMDGIEVGVQFDEGYKSVLLSIGCQKDAKLLNFVKLRSEIIKQILLIKSRCSKEIEMSESFIYPPSLTSQPSCTHDQFCFSKERIQLAVTSDKRFVTSKQNATIGQVCLKKILYMEPLHLLPTNVITQIFNAANPSLPIHHSLLEAIRLISKADNSGFLDLALKSSDNYKQIQDFIETYSIFTDLKVCMKKYAIKNLWV